MSRDNQLYIIQINHTHEVVLVARDGSRPPFSCYSKETLVQADTESEETVEPTHGWCATCHHNCKNIFILQQCLSTMKHLNGSFMTIL